MYIKYLHKIFTLSVFDTVQECIYNIYKASFSPGWKVFTGPVFCNLGGEGDSQRQDSIFTLLLLAYFCLFEK
jgi:hypothetical protein